MVIYKAYKFRLYPAEKQKILLNKHFGCCRYIYNYGLEQKIKTYAGTGKSIERYQIDKHIPHLKEENLWLKEVNAQSLQSELIHLESAFTKFYKEKTGFPEFKNKIGKQSYTVPQYFEVFKTKIRIPKFREGIKFVKSQEVEGKIKSLTISKTSAGKYFVSILTEQEINIIQKPIDKKTAIGIDLGLTDFAITSNGKKFKRNRFIKAKQKKLKKLQQKLCRQKKDSNSRNKTKLKVAIVHEKITNQRKDYLHKISRELVNENQVNTFCLENLNIQGMIKNPKLAKQIQDVGWGEFVRQMNYKSFWKGKNILEIGKFDPSSKTCSNCGFINQNLTLKDREWICPDCSISHDRDINAANNIKNFAFIKFKTTVGTTECNVLGDEGILLSMKRKAQ
jgi:putative transposase